MTVFEIAAPNLEWGLLAPALVVLAGGVLGIVFEAIVPRGARYGVQVIVTSLALISALLFAIRTWASGEIAIAAMGSLAFDGPTVVVWIALLFFGLLAMLLFAERGLTGGASAFVSSGASVPGSPVEREADDARLEHTEVYPLMLFAIFGMMLFAASNDLLMMFVALEIFSLPLYLLSGLAKRRRLLSQEAALKYFLLGALSSAFFLFGVALLYGYAGTFSLGGIAAAISANRTSFVLLIAGLGLVLVGLLFKIGAVPFHAWTPDVYTGAPTPVTGFMAIATKMAAVAALLRVLYVALGGISWNWQPVIVVIAIITMALGGAVAIAQTDIKRMLAYSSIAHAGFILVGLLGTNRLSVPAIVFYLVAYGFATLGAFAIVTMVRSSGGEANGLAAWQGIGRRHPVVGGIFVLFILSFAGIPLTAGFMGKLEVFRSAWIGGYSWLVFVAVIMSLVAAYFYLRTIVIVFFTEPTDETAQVVYPSSLTWAVVWVSAIGTIVLGILPGALMQIVTAAGMFIR